MQCSHYVYPATHTDWYCHVPECPAPIQSPIPSPGQMYTCTSDMAEFIFAFPTLIFIMPENRGPHTPPANCKRVQLAYLFSWVESLGGQTIEAVGVRRLLLGLWLHGTICSWHLAALFNRLFPAFSSAVFIANLVYALVAFNEKKHLNGRRI